MENIENKLLEIIKYHIGININEVFLTDDTNIFKDYGMDSIQIVNIISDIEMAFNIHLTMDQQTMDAIQRYGCLKEYIHSKICSTEAQSV